MVYEQSVYWTKISYINEKFWCEHNWISGIREENNHSVKLGIGKSLFDEIELRMESKRVASLEKYFALIKKNLINTNLDFDAILYLHNEIVLIDKVKRDNRSYGFVRLMIKMDGKKIYVEDIPIYTSTLFGIEEIMDNWVKNACNRYNNIGSCLEKKIFKDMTHVLSAKVAGFFIHEIIGHLLESDHFTYLKNRYCNVKIAPQLTVTDSVQGFQKLVGFNKYDDIGNKVRSITLVKDGRINNIMALDEKDSFNNEIYGFARRATFKDKIMPRMRNTYIEPYKVMNRQDILNQYEKAVLVDETNFGAVNNYTGEFKLYGSGYVVKNGVPQNFINDLCVYGNIEKNLSKIDYIGNDIEIYGGYCDKLGQSIHVGCGGPTISLSELTSEGVIYGRGQKSRKKTVELWN